MIRAITVHKIQKLTKYYALLKFKRLKIFLWEFG